MHTVCLYVRETHQLVDQKFLARPNIPTSFCTLQLGCWQCGKCTAMSCVKAIFQRYFGETHAVITSLFHVGRWVIVAR